jgi:hypothetical protein
VSGSVLAVGSEKWFHFFELFPFPFLDSLSFSGFEGLEDFVFFCWGGKCTKKLIPVFIHK